MTINLAKRIPVGKSCAYTGISRRDTMIFPNSRSFEIAIYGAYDVFGLIGPEQNGIVILDNDNLRVVLDRYFEIQTGYFGPSENQIKEYLKIAAMNWEQFVEFVNNNERMRDKI